MKHETRPIIFVSMENWDEVWRRNQFLCAEMARRWPGTKILFVGLSRDLSRAVRQRDLTDVRVTATGRVPGFENLFTTRPLKLLPDSIPGGTLINESLFRRDVHNAAKELGISKPVLWLNPHTAVHMVGKMGEQAVVYDITDDWALATQSRTSRERIVRQDAELCRKADAVIVCSQRLLEMKKLLSERVHLIPNGVDVEHYAAVAEDGPVPDVAKEWAKPVFGYTGTAHPDRVDVNLVAALSENLAREGRGAKGGSLVFVGPNHLPKDVVERLTQGGRGGRGGNVFFTGPVPYQKIPEYMRAFDVCIVPHCMSAFTESLNPIKLFEYLAAGKPIVASDVAGFRDFPELVRIARTADEFFGQMMLALQEGDSKLQARREEAAKHSWKSRVDEIERVLREVEEKKSLAPSANNA